MQQNENQFLFKVMWLAIVFLSVAGCENSFEPLQDTGRHHFSIFGTLDFSADTQWVRVMPIYDSLFVTSKEPIDAKVTLTRQSTGEVVVLNDTLMQYSREVYAWNFWTAVPLHDNEEYTLKAEASDGRASSATVIIPPDFPTPIVDYSTETEQGSVTCLGIERLVVANVIFTAQIIGDGAPPSPPIEITISYMNQVQKTAAGNFRFFPNDAFWRVASALNVTPDRVVIVDREVFVVSAGPEWPDYEDLSEEEILLPEIHSNIENGLGVLVGIVSKRFPLESCYDEEDGELVSCPAQ